MKSIFSIFKKRRKLSDQLIDSRRIEDELLQLTTQLSAETEKEIRAKYEKWIADYKKKFGEDVKLVETLVEYQDNEMERRVEEAKKTAEAEDVGGDDNEENV